jgi:hypothetical protein
MQFRSRRLQRELMEHAFNEREPIGTNSVAIKWNRWPHGKPAVFRKKSHDRNEKLTFQVTFNFFIMR